MNNTVKFVAVCVAAPVMALGVAAPTAWAETGTGHSHTNGGPIVDSHTNGGPIVHIPPPAFEEPMASSRLLLIVSLSGDKRRI
jgi:hypothetical protein